MMNLESSSGGAFLDWLVTEGRLTRVLADRVVRVRAETADRLAGVLLKLGLLSEGDLAEALSRYTGLARLDPGSVPAERLSIPNYNAEFARAREVAPVSISAQALELACWDALDEYAPRALEFTLGRRIEQRIGTRTEIRVALERLYPRQEDGSAAGASAAVGAVEDEEVDRLKDLASDAPVIRLVQRLINEAISARASDIHLEPTERALKVRLRLDGLLREIESHPRELSAAIVSRVKVLAGLNIAERRLPQDGRIRVTVQGKDVDFRVATTPVLHGESVVLRILDRQDVALDFKTLGFDADLQSILRRSIERPYGIVLVTGPTGSGKTTTLYAALKEINTPDKKIITVEDPVEYVLEGVNQVPIRPAIGLTFAQALRAFLRQDPDVLMVGEIRDRETAEIAVQAALTGHLLFSTLHTNTASGAITRLLDMGIDDFLLTSTLHVVLAQRLVRRLCTECREPYSPTEEIRSRLATDEEAGPWFRARGCPSCQGTGYRGRTAILEALEMTDELRSVVLSRADAHMLERTAVQRGMRTMLRHGVQRIASGVTSVEEVLRVTSLS
ncbi:MAG: ATPase, T2SS/T4P/T4SS family [Steroidobacteraceae bacterium]